MLQLFLPRNVGLSYLLSVLPAPPVVLSSLNLDSDIDDDMASSLALTSWRQRCIGLANRGES